MPDAASRALGATAAGEPIALELPRLIGTHACIVANSGGGKSGLIRRLLEVTHGQVQHIVLDIEDEFYTLRERFDYVIAGGEGGDTPATLAGAESLAIAALTHGFSLVVQMNDLGPDAPAFVGRFLEAMIAAPRDLWRPVLVVLDEAQRFAPQDGTTDATRGVKALTAQGRKRGFTAVLASQRIAKIDADVRGDVNNWMLGRVGQSLDRRTMADALGFAGSSAEARGLQGLPDRTFWGFGPAISREPTLFRVADVQTTPVRPGQTKVATPPPPEALREILEGIAGVAETQKIETARAAYDAGTAAGELLIEKDARIAAIEAELADARAEVDHLRGVDAECERYQDGLGAMEELRVRIRRGYQPMDSDAGPPPTGGSGVMEPTPMIGRRGEPFSTDLQSSAELSTKAADRESSSLPSADRGVASAAKEPAPHLLGAGSAPRSALGAERKPLAVLAGAAPAGLTEASWATLAGFKRTGGTWGTYKSRLRTAGLIEAFGSLWHATPAGIAAIGGEVVPLPAPGPELVMRWAKALPGVSRMLYVLQKRYPHLTTRDALAADLGMAASGGTFGTYLSRLRANGLLEEKGKRLRLTPALMERSA